MMLDKSQLKDSRRITICIGYGFLKRGIQLEPIPASPNDIR